MRRRRSEEGRRKAYDSDVRVTRKLRLSGGKLIKTVNDITTITKKRERKRKRRKRGRKREGKKSK